MGTQAKQLQGQIENPTTTWNWKRIWRGNAVINLLGGDLLLFATQPVIKFTGMDDTMQTPLRVFGVICLVYGIWQLWAARTGSVSRSTFYVGDAVETLVGLTCFGVVLGGLELNQTGVASIIFLGILGWLTAGLWFVGSRSAAE